MRMAILGCGRNRRHLGPNYRAEADADEAPIGNLSGRERLMPQSTAAVGLLEWCLAADEPSQ